MSRHNCPGEDCARCQRLIDEREFGVGDSGTDWQAGQDMYESHLDRMGGSA